MTVLKRSLILHLNVCILFYALSAVLDTWFTLNGIRGDISLEGNPLMRHMMVIFGQMGGLIIEKTLVLVIALIITIFTIIGIHRDSDWIYFLVLTRLVRQWMKRKKRYWLAFVPLYLVALAQGLATASWAYLIVQSGRV